MEITQAEIEIVARAICEAHGQDPDQLRLDTMSGADVPAWWLLRSQATTQIAAFRAIKSMPSMMQKNGPIS